MIYGYLLTAININDVHKIWQISIIIKLQLLVVISTKFKNITIGPERKTGCKANDSTNLGEKNLVYLGNHVTSGPTISLSHTHVHARTHAVHTLTARAT